MVDNVAQKAAYISRWQRSRVKRGCGSGEAPAGSGPKYSTLLYPPPPLHSSRATSTIRRPPFSRMSWATSRRAAQTSDWWRERGESTADRSERFWTRQPWEKSLYQGG